MKAVWERTYAKLVESQWDKLVWDNHLLLENHSGHTKETAQCVSCHNATSTAVWYSIGTVLGKIKENEGLLILTALEKQQITDQDSPYYGCMRWYGEETKIYDTNGAFFVQRALLITRKMLSQYLFDSHKIIIDRILSRGSHWFAKELANPILYYSNKILSDGAMLIGIASITDNKEYYDHAKKFFTEWIDYTQKRGWGWGENLSIGYNGVIFSALKLALLSLDPADQALKQDIDSMIKTQLDFFRFYNGYEVTPAIRNYNYDGQSRRWSLIYNLAGVPGFAIEDEEDVSAADAVCLAMLFNDELYYDHFDFEKRNPESLIQVPRVQITRIFDNKYAYSWAGENGSIGSINSFPVIDGSYQHPTWGLGWQCMPFNFVVNEAQVSYLRWRVNTGHSMRYHPKRNFLSPALFDESHYPDVTTSCAQKNNVCVVFRSMRKVNNSVCEIADELFIPRYDDYAIKVNKTIANDREWVIISYKTATVLVSPLLGVFYHSENKIELDKQLSKADSMEALKYENQPRTQGRIELIHESDGYSLRQTCYNGQDGVLVCERLEAGWLTIFVDRSMTVDEVQAYLNTIRISNESRTDGCIPRTSSYELQEVSITERDQEILKHTFDPYSA